MSGLPGCMLACMSTFLAYLPGLSSFLPICSLIAWLYLPNSLSCLPACSLACLTANLPSMSSRLPAVLSACLSACHLSCHADRLICLHTAIVIEIAKKMSNVLAHLKLQGLVLPDYCRFPWASCTCSNTNYSLRIFTISYFHCTRHLLVQGKKWSCVLFWGSKIEKQNVSKIFKNIILWIKNKKKNRHAIGELRGVFTLYI
jgi:hypothetical protein